MIAAATIAATLVAGVPVRRAAHVPVLRHSVVLASVVSIDPPARSAVVRVSCGWSIDPKGRIRTGLWRVRLNGVELGLSATPMGENRTVSLADWFRVVRKHGWSGSISLDWHGVSVVSNGPTTDICRGVFP